MINDQRSLRALLSFANLFTSYKKWLQLGIRSPHLSVCNNLYILINIGHYLIRVLSISSEIFQILKRVQILSMEPVKITPLLKRTIYSLKWKSKYMLFFHESVSRIIHYIITKNHPKSKILGCKKGIIKINDFLRKCYTLFS